MPKVASLGDDFPRRFTLTVEGIGGDHAVGETDFFLGEEFLGRGEFIAFVVGGHGNWDPVFLVDEANHLPKLMHDGFPIHG